MKTHELLGSFVIYVGEFVANASGARANPVHPRATANYAQGTGTIRAWHE